MPTLTASTLRLAMDRMVLTHGFCPPARDLWREAWRGARLARHLGRRVRHSRAALDLELSAAGRLGVTVGGLNVAAWHALTRRDREPSLPTVRMMLAQSRARMRRAERRWLSPAAEARCDAADLRMRMAREMADA